METISAEEFRKRYGSVTPQAPVTEENGYGSQVSDAFQGGVSKIGQGIEQANPTKKGGIGGLISGVGKILGGATEAITSPFAPPVQVTLGKGINAIGAQIGKNPSVQKFATSPAGEKTAQVAETVGDYANAAGLIAGGAGAKVPVKPGFRTTMSEAPRTPSKTGEYVSSAIRDLTPTKQGFINEQVSKALDLTPGDLDKISRSTGNDVGTWLSENNLIGKNKAETQSMVDNFYKQNYDQVRSEIGKVTKTYKPNQVKRYTDALKQIQSKIQGVPGLEEAATTVDNLLSKKDGIKLADVQTVKELMDEHFNLYKNTGDVGEGVVKQGLANMRDEVKTFIEDEVGTADIKKLNNNVSTSRSLNEAITTRTPKGLTRSNIRMGDLPALGVGFSVAGPIGAGAALLLKKMWESPTVRLRIARYVDQLSDAQKAKVKAQLQTGELPPEFEPLISQEGSTGTQGQAPKTQSPKE